MNRKEAMEMAVNIVDVWTEAPQSSAKGFGNNADKFASIKEKTEAALQLAEFLWDAEDVMVVNSAEGEVESTRG